MKIKDQVIVVTGASGGIGLATARLLAKQGAKVALVARSADKLAATEKELPGSKAFVADMAQENQVGQLIAAIKAHFGRIDVLINNAGRGQYGSVATFDLKDYRAMFELNVVGPVVAIQTVVPIMKTQGGGLIINISSGVSKNYFPELAAYASTKYALNALTLTARAELAQDNIRVCLVHPGLTATEFGANATGELPAFFGNNSSRPAGETPEQVAAKIAEAIETEAAETFTDNLAHLRGSGR